MVSVEASVVVERGDEVEEIEGSEKMIRGGEWEPIKIHR
jgi:hypothetical protein